MDFNTRLTDVFRLTFDDETIELHDSMTADDIELWDSVSHISLIFAIEDEFQIRLSTKDLENARNLGDMKRAIKKRLTSHVGPERAEI